MCFLEWHCHSPMLSLSHKYSYAHFCLYPVNPHSFCCWCWFEFVCVCVEVACLCCCFVPYRDISVQTDDEVSTVYFVVKQLLCPVAKLQSMLLKKLKDTKRQARLLTIKEFWGFVGRNILYICLYTSAICYNSLPGTGNKITLPKLYQIPKHNGAFRKELTWKHQLISDQWQNLNSRQN